MRLFTESKLIGVGGITALIALPSVWASPSAIPRQAPSISWFACPDTAIMQCAFFEAPRDYSNPSDNDTVSIFMRRFPATASPENRLGSILVNPGGPGGSGSYWALLAAEALSTLVDGRYDIIGFDPRGVNLTAPWTDCFDFESEAVHSEYQLELYGIPYPHSSLSNDRAFVRKLSALQATHNAACLRKGNQKMLESVGTASIVQDMERMVEALGEDGLNYLGYSYGTILGATFAAMRPNLVKRMVLDGVSNAESYFSDILQWGRDGMAETHKTMTGFLSTCIEAGPKYCKFAVPPDNSNKTQTVESLRKRLDAIYVRLDKDPLIVTQSGVGPSLFTASDLQRVLLGLLYEPVGWSGAMEVLAQLEKRDSSGLTGFRSPFADLHPQSYIDTRFNRTIQRSAYTRESLRAIACGDSAASNISINAYTDYYLELGKISPVGESWAALIGPCRGWSFRANQRYTGPWTIEKGLKKTRFPILFASLDADPVTPLRSAVKMARGFGNESATLLVQKGFGHCTTAHPSLCTQKHIRDYFVDGKVPANGTHCTAEPGFIYPTNSTTMKRESLGIDKREMEILDALETLRKARAGFGRMV